MELGAQVSGLAVGDRVMAAVTGGAFAEQAVAEHTDVVRLPDSLDFVTAAGFPVA